jgi:[acyl-carrier-protein] S-malonyltransferase
MSDAGARLAFVFPGQGAQFVGMGKDLFEGSEAARRVFAQADEALGFALSRLCFEGPEAELNDTINTQPAVLTASIAAFEALCERWRSIGANMRAEFVAGHSLGEYSALVASGSLSFPEAVRAVRERGRLMKEAGLRSPGGMAAILGLGDSDVDDVCREASAKGVVVPANYNSPGQVVISGEVGALGEAMQLALSRGARRAMRLAVSIAAHSPLMTYASEHFDDVVERLSLGETQPPLVPNVTAQVISSARDIRRELSDQLCHSVLWNQSVRKMAEHGTTTFVEIGPGNVLSGLVKRIVTGVEAMSIGDAKSIEDKGLSLARRLGA